MNDRPHPGLPHLEVLNLLLRRRGHHMDDDDNDGIRSAAAAVLQAVQANRMEQATHGDAQEGHDLVVQALLRAKGESEQDSVALMLACNTTRW